MTFGGEQDTEKGRSLSGVSTADRAVDHGLEREAGPGTGLCTDIGSMSLINRRQSEVWIPGQTTYMFFSTQTH